jgi:hypothetical protein
MSEEIDFDFWKEKKDLVPSHERDVSWYFCSETLTRSAQQAIDLEKLKNISESLVVENEESFSQAVSMSLQIRRIKKCLEDKRKDLVAPYVASQKEINKQAKSIEKDLVEIEDILSVKVNDYSSKLLSLDKKIINEDGTAKLTKKIQWSISDESLIAREYLKVDEEKINQAIDMGIINIPGICIQETEIVELRAKRIKK